MGVLSVDVLARGPYHATWQLQSKGLAHHSTHTRGCGFRSSSMYQLYRGALHDQGDYPCQQLQQNSNNVLAQFQDSALTAALS